MATVWVSDIATMSSLRDTLCSRVAMSYYHSRSS